MRRIALYTGCNKLKPSTVFEGIQLIYSLTNQMKASYINLFVCVCLSFVCSFGWLVGCMFVSAKDKEEQNCSIFSKKNRHTSQSVFFLFLLKNYSLIFHKFQLTAVCCSCLTVSQSIRVLSTLCRVSISAARISISVAL